jgi:hypothetical protein
MKIMAKGRRGGGWHGSIGESGGGFWRHRKKKTRACEKRFNAAVAAKYRGYQYRQYCSLAMAKASLKSWPAIWRMAGGGII